MNWEAIGAVGEIGGAIGVIVTLIYLANQLRQNTNALRSSAYESYNQTSNSFWDFLAQHATQLSEVLQHSSLDQLTSEQTYLYMSFAMKIFNSMETTFLHHRAGSLEQDVFEGRLTGFHSTMTDELLVQSWQRQQRLGFSQDFQVFMNSRIIGTPSQDV